MNRVAGQTALAGVDVGVLGEAALALQVQDKSPDLPGGYQGDIGIQPIRDQELLEVADAVGNDVDGVLALALALGAQPVPGGEVGQVGGRAMRIFDEASTPPLYNRGFWG